MRGFTLVGLAAAVFAAVAVSRPADACSLADGFIAPTNVELVKQAAAIVVAHADAYAPGRDLGTFTFTVTDVIKSGGLAKGAGLTLAGFDQYGGRSKPDDFSRARPGAYAGGCVAYDYRVGKSFLLLLRRDRGTWSTLGVPFARVNEEIDPKGEPWLDAVRAYVRVLALPPAQQGPALAKLVALGGAIAADVTAHLAAATPDKPFAMLARRFAEAQGDRSQLLLAIGKGGDPAATTFMRTVVAQLASGKLERVDARTALVAVAAYYARVPDPDKLAPVARLYTQLGSAKQELRWPLMWLLIKHGDVALRPLMETALAGASDEEAGRLGEYFARARSKRAIADLAARTNKHYAEHWELALALAGAGDPDVVAWARSTLASTTTDRWVAAYVLARSPLAIADTLAATVIARGGDDLVSLVQGYEEARHPYAEARLKQIEATSPSGVLAEWVTRTREGRQAPFDPSR